MYDIVRWIILGLIFAGLFAAWYWSWRQKRQDQGTGNAGSTFKVLKKRWVDQRTGVCLIEAEEQTFLLAYTVGGGVSWQPVDKVTPDFEKTLSRINTNAVLTEAGKR